MPERPKVGIGGIVVKDGQILLGYRLSEHDYGVWSAPGGHLEHAEDLKTCASREILEECGFKIPPESWRLAAVTNDIFPKSGKHYVTLTYIVHVTKGEPKLAEPDKWREWRWFDPENLPKPLMRSLQNALDAGLSIDPKSESVTS
jgi:8-oxo-dGTP diphosphatase